MSLWFWSAFTLNLFFWFLASLTGSPWALLAQALCVVYMIIWIICTKRYRLYRFKIDEKKRSYGKKPVYYMRRFYHLYRRPHDRDIAEFYIETIIRSDSTSTAYLQVGSAGSEHPFKIALVIFGCGFYAGIGSKKLRKLAHRITNGDKKTWDDREITFRIFGGHLYWNFWTLQHEWKASTPRWRHGSCSLIPAEWIWGHKSYSYKDLGRHETMLFFDEGGYPVNLTLQEQTLKRKRAKRAISTEFTIDVDAPQGIPTHYDKSGGWKGDRTYGWGIPFGLPLIDWEKRAEKKVSDWVLAERDRTGFVEAQAQD